MKNLKWISQLKFQTFVATRHAAALMERNLLKDREMHVNSIVLNPIIKF